MSKEKQIEEMAEVYYKARLKARDTLGSMNEGEEMWYSKAFYEAGYRKQSAWISVEERLPDEDVRVLVYIKSERSYTKFDTDRLKHGKWVRWYSDVTHWMPLPEAPKMKGGAE